MRRGDRTGRVAPQCLLEIGRAERRPKMGYRLPQCVIHEHRAAGNALMQLGRDVARLPLHPVRVGLPCFQERRNILFGDSFSSLDTSLMKDFRFYRENSIQLRAEAFNLFNHANFNLPANRITQGTFGRITTAQDPRILQFALKLRF